MPRQTPLSQSGATLHGSPPRHGAQTPPQSMALSSPFKTPSTHLAGRHRFSSHTPLWQDNAVSQRLHLRGSHPPQSTLTQDHLTSSYSRNLVLFIHADTTTNPSNRHAAAFARYNTTAINIFSSPLSPRRHTTTLIVVPTTTTPRPSMPPLKLMTRYRRTG